MPMMTARVRNYETNKPFDRFFDSVTVVLDAPEGAVLKNVLGEGAQSIDPNWTITPGATAGGRTTWTLTQKNRYIYQMGVTPVWHFPSPTFGSVDAVINYHSMAWTYHGNPTPYTETFAPGVLNETYHFDNDELMFVNVGYNVQPTTGTHVHEAQFIAEGNPGAHGFLGKYGFGNRGGLDSLVKWVEIIFDEDKTADGLAKMGITGLHLADEIGARDVSIEYRWLGETGWPHQTTVNVNFADGGDPLRFGAVTREQLPGFAEDKYIGAIRYKLDHTDANGKHYGVKSGNFVNASSPYYYGINLVPATEFPAFAKIRVTDFETPVKPTVEGRSRTDVGVPASAISVELLKDREITAGNTQDFSARIWDFHASTIAKFNVSKTPVIFLRDETGLGISDVKLKKNGVDLITAYPGRVTVELDHEEAQDPHTGKTPKVYRIDTRGFNDDSLTFEEQYKAAVGFYRPTFDLKRDELTLEWKLVTTSDYNDKETHHLNHDVVWVTDPVMEAAISGRGRKTDDFHVDGADGKPKVNKTGLVVSMPISAPYYVIKSRTDLIVTTQAKADFEPDTAWKNYNGSPDDLIKIHLENKYDVKLAINNLSGNPTKGPSYIFLPVPKLGEQWGEINKGYPGGPDDIGAEIDSFGYETVLTDEVKIAAGVKGTYTIHYGTFDTTAFTPTTPHGTVGNALRAFTGWGIWDASKAADYNVIRITANAIPPALDPLDSFTMRLTADLPGNVHNAVNIYRPVYWEDLTDPQGKPLQRYALGDWIGIQILTAKIKGQVFLDGNLNAMWDDGEGFAPGAFDFSGWTIGAFVPGETEARSTATLTADGAYELDNLSRVTAYELRLKSPNDFVYVIGPNQATPVTDKTTVGTYNFFKSEASDDFASTAAGTYAVDEPGTPNPNENGLQQASNGIYNIGLKVRKTTWTFYSHEEMGSFTNSQEDPSEVFTGDKMHERSGPSATKVGVPKVTEKPRFKFIGWREYPGTAEEFANQTPAQKRALSTGVDISDPNSFFPPITDDTVLGLKDRMLYAVYVELIDVSVEKVWENDLGLPNPESVKVTLHQDGTAVGEAVVLDKSNVWKHTWTDLRKQDDKAVDHVYTVTEEDVPGYATVISGDTESGFVVTNTQQAPPPIMLSFVGTKVLTGATLTEGQFTFVLIMPDNDGVEVTNDADGNIVFPDYEVTMPGTYNFTMKEKAGATPGMTYSKDEFTFVVEVEYDVATAELAATEVVTKKNGSDFGGDVVFENSYKEPPTPSVDPDYEPISVEVDAHKTLKGRSLKGGEFTFVIKDGSGKVLETVTNQKDGKVDFKARRFSRTGSFVYTIEEVAGTSQSYRYDKTVYKAVVTVTAAGGKLTASVSYEKNGIPFDGTPTFVNTARTPATGDSMPQQMMLMLLGAVTLLGAYWLIRRRHQLAHKA